MMEPFKIKSVEHIRITTKEERIEAIRKAEYNLFNIPSELVMIDLLTDSGTGAMSDEQWSAIMTGDESYANSRSFGKLKRVVEDIFNYNYFLPVHQGRAAEVILSSMLINKGEIVPSNNHFDTTSANILNCEATPIDMIKEENELFKGNINILTFEKYLCENHKKIPYCMITITNNAGGGQPVSLENIRKVYQICKKYGKKLFIDACRFAENCWFIQKNEEICKGRSIKEIAKELFSYSDGATFSAKKDAIMNIGGLLLLNDYELFEKAKTELILREGFTTYGGLSGRDINAMSIGLEEGCNQEYLDYRIGQVRELHDKLLKEGIPIVSPPGGHAVYIDAGKILKHIPKKEFPAQSFSIECYIEGGIRSVEVGSLMLSYKSPDTGKMIYPELELVRFAIPRRTYTQSHIQHVVDTIKKVYHRSKNIKGIHIKNEPKTLRHFTASFNYI